MRANSEDLRGKIVTVCEEDELTHQAVADLFHVSVAFVQNVLRRWYQEGQLAPRPHSGGFSATLAGPVLARLEGWISRQPDLALAELCARLDRQCGICVSLSTMWRALQRLGLARKKRRCLLRSGTLRASSVCAGLGGTS
jgi:transposase